MILDRFGNEVPIVRVRESIGFIRQQLVDDPTHEVNAPTPIHVREFEFEDNFTGPLIARRRDGQSAG